MAPLLACTATTVSLPTLTLAGARIALAAAENRAREIGISMNIAIVSASLHLLLFTRMDGAKLTSISIAMDKAFTAAGHRMPTSSYKENVWPGGVAYGLGTSNSGRFCTIGGGVPVIDDQGNVLGAIGCSTGTPAQDEDVAIAGRDAVLQVIGSEVEEKASAEQTALPRPESQLGRKRARESASDHLQCGRHVKQRSGEITPPAEQVASN